MVDDFDGDAAGQGFGEGTRGVAVERGPGVFVDLGLEGGLEGAVGIVSHRKKWSVVNGQRLVRRVSAGVDGTTGTRSVETGRSCRVLSLNLAHALARRIAVLISASTQALP